MFFCHFVVIFAFVVLALVYQLRAMSPKWHILCLVGHKILTLSQYKKKSYGINFDGAF